MVTRRTQRSTSTIIRIIEDCEQCRLEWMSSPVGYHGNFENWLYFEMLELFLIVDLSIKGISSQNSLSSVLMFPWHATEDFWLSSSFLWCVVEILFTIFTVLTLVFWFDVVEHLDSLFNVTDMIPMSYMCCCLHLWHKTVFFLPIILNL